VGSKIDVVMTSRAIGAALVASLASVVPVGTQQSPMRVTARADLIASTPLERELAAYFDREGPRLERIVELIVDGVTPAPDADGNPPPRTPPGTYLRNAACHAAGIVVGRAVLEKVLLNESESSLFSIYSISVDDRVHPRDGARRVTAAVAGGVVHLADGTTLGFTINHWRDYSGTRLFFLYERLKSGVLLIGSTIPVQDTRAPVDGWQSDPYLPREFEGPIDPKQLIHDLRAAARLGCP
jgi:hypothetical protein